MEYSSEMNYVYALIHPLMAQIGNQLEIDQAIHTRAQPKPIHSTSTLWARNAVGFIYPNSHGLKIEFCAISC